jgi:hypothetical protein
MRTAAGRVGLAVRGGAVLHGRVGGHNMGVVVALVVETVLQTSLSIMVLLASRTRAKTGKLLGL